MNSYKLQTRYAQSLFDLALEKNISKQVYQNMLLVMDVCKQNRELRVVLKNPVIKPCKKKSIVNDVFSGRVEELTLAFVELLIAKRRDILLFEIAERYTYIYKEYNHIKTVKLTTAESIDESMLQLVSDKIREVLQSEIDLQTEVNKDLIGGFHLFVDGKLYDASFMKQFSKLKTSFSKNVYEKIF